MSKTSKYTQGGDSQAIKAIADDYYGSYTNMFEAHEWPERSAKILPAVQSRVVEAYGSVLSFEQAHQRSELMFPMEAIKSDPPNVWLTSFYGFNPEEWGMLGFADAERRQSFLDASKPGVLVVVYGAGKASKEELGQVIGIQQCSHQTGHSKQFISPVEWQKKERDPERVNKWNYAVKATRAWRVTPESRIGVREFAPEATSTEAWQHIGSRGKSLKREEAFNIFKLELQECDVFGEMPISESLVGTAKQILAPSKAGPVSQSPHMVQEAEGPKHLYILKLIGDTDAFLGEAAKGQLIVKAGFSKSPQTRRNDHNRTLPQCAFQWELMYSGPQLDISPYPTSDHAKAGEKAMQNALLTTGSSLGGEFFLADNDTIEAAWLKGNAAAKDFSK